jgi:hypothetical protein
MERKLLDIEIEETPIDERTIRNIMKIVKKARFLIQLADGSLTFVSYDNLHFMQTTLDEFMMNNVGVKNG